MDVNKESTDDSKIPVLQRIFKEISKAWEIIVYVRFSLVVVLIAGYALYANDQVKDLLAGLENSIVHQILFFIAVIWWTMQGWGWARYILNGAYGFDTNRTVNERSADLSGKSWFLINNLPRIIGIGAIVIATISVYLAKAPFYLMILLPVAGVAVYWFFQKRRKLLGSRLRMLASQPPSRFKNFTLSVVVILFLCAYWFPVPMGGFLGAGAVAFFGLGSIVPIGSMLVDITRRKGIPVLTLLILFAIFFSYFNDNHKIRDLESASDRPPLSMMDALEQWKSQFSSEERNSPMVLINTAGGGLRAAYWTGVVLGSLEDAMPGFHRYIFAISGVSGGSVGSVFYNAALINAMHAKAGEKNRGRFSTSLLAAIGKDYLAPTVAGMLYPDLLQRFLPYPFLPDRAAALEKGFESGFSREYPDQPEGCGLKDNFRSHWSDQCIKVKDQKNWLPLLFINGTYEETGRRIITSPVHIENRAFLDSHDFFELNGRREIRASTAAHNSARFTYISPAGTFQSGKTSDSGAGKGHIIDGGYFENFGAETLRDILSWLKNHREQLGDRELMIISISNDSGMSREDYTLGTLAKPREKRFLNETLAPLIGLLKTRVARGVLAQKALWRDFGAVKENQPSCDMHEACAFFNLDAVRDEDGNALSAPLGWVLSDTSKDFMSCSLNDSGNGDEICRLLKTVRSKNKAAFDKLVNKFPKGGE